jgi:hypothetical protein
VPAVSKGIGLPGGMVLAEQKKKNLWYFLIDIKLNLELVQQKDIHRTNIDINKIYNNREACE